MTLLDFIVLLLVGVAAVGGFMRGLVQEVLSLAAWVLAILAIYFFHADVTQALYQLYDSPGSTALLAFVLLLIIPYLAMRFIAAKAGESSRNSVLGPIDRVLGFGFGAIKGVIISIMAFSLLVLGYDNNWGPAGRPTWITQARTYPFINASTDAMVLLVRQRRQATHELEVEEVDGA